LWLRDFADLNAGFRLYLFNTGDFRQGKTKDDNAYNLE
jgi:hypothetical protein